MNYFNWLFNSSEFWFYYKIFQFVWFELVNDTLSIKFEFIIYLYIYI